jgi:hypothetical protein
MSIDRTFLASLSAEAIGETLFHAVSEEFFEAAELGQIIRSGSLDVLDDEQLGLMVKGGVDEGHIEPETIGQLILDQIRAATA